MIAHFSRIARDIAVASWEMIKYMHTTRIAKANSLREERFSTSYNLPNLSKTVLSLPEVFTGFTIQTLNNTTVRNAVIILKSFQNQTF